MVQTVGQAASRWVLLGWLATSALLLSAGCGAAPLGTVKGVVPPCPGASGHVHPGLVVSVQIWQGGTPLETLSVGSPYSFRVQLSPGMYRLTAGSSQVPATVTVKAGKVVAADLYPDCG